MLKISRNHYKINFVLIAFLIAFVPKYTFADDKGNLYGTVIDTNKKPIEGMTVRLSNLQTDYVTDRDGKFKIEGLEAGNYTIKVSGVGYDVSEQNVNIIGGKTINITITLFSSSTTLQGVAIYGKNKTQQVKEQAIRTVVVDMKAAADQPATVAELMNRAPGIRIRQSGGLGNAVDVSVNGFQGNSVQYFRDGIPLEYLGGGYSINNVPPNLLQRTEIYKGVIPISLGSDALGGAVNMITPNHYGSELNASYEIASFNTHIANLSFYHTDKKISNL